MNAFSRTLIFKSMRPLRVNYLHIVIGNVRSIGLWRPHCIVCHGYLKNASLRGVSNEAARIGLAAKGINRLQAGGRRTHGAELPAAPASASRQIRITHIECHLIGKYKKPNRVVLMHLLNKRLYTTHFKVTNAVSFNNVHHSICQRIL